MAFWHGVSRSALMAGRFGLVVLSLFTVAGYYSGADILSHFRLHYAAALLLIALILVSGGLRRLALAAFLLAGLNLASALHYAHKPLVTKSTGRPLKVITLNTLYWARNSDAIVEFLGNESPDLIFLQELRADKLSILRRLAKAYPWQKHCAHQEGCGLAVLSRHRWQAAATAFIGDSKGRYIWARFGSEFANLTVADIHLRWPYFSNQKADLDALHRDLEKSHGPLLIAGDFNATPWSGTLRSFTRSAKLLPAGPYRPTWPVRKFAKGVICGLCIPQLQIDHIFVSDEMRVLSSHTGPRVGSDHLPLIVKLIVPSQAVAHYQQPRKSP